MSAEAPRDRLPVPRAVRGLLQRTGGLAGRDVAGLARLAPHLLVHGDAERVAHVWRPALENAGWTGPPLLAEPDPVAFARRVTAPAVEAAVLMPGPAGLGATLAPLQGLLERLRERVPTVLADTPEEDVAAAHTWGFDLVTPPLRGIHPARDVLEDALLLRRLFRDACGQGRVADDRPGGCRAPAGRLLLVQRSGPELDALVERLIGLGHAWEACDRPLRATHRLLHGDEAFDAVMMHAAPRGLAGLDTLRLMRQARRRLPPLILHGGVLGAAEAEAAWHNAAWAWCSDHHLRHLDLGDLLRRAMNLSRARRRERDAEQGA